MTGAGADDVASEMEGMTISRGWHGAKHFGAKKKKIPCCALERHVLGKSACKVACELVGSAELGLVLGKCLGLMQRKSAWKFCLVRFNTKPVVMSHKEFVRGVPTKKCLGKVVPTTPRHTIMWEGLLSPWARLKRSVVNIREEM